MFDLKDYCRDYLLLFVPYFGTSNWRHLWELDSKSHEDSPNKKGDFLYDISTRFLSIYFSKLNLNILGIGD